MQLKLSISDAIINGLFLALFEIFYYIGCFYTDRLWGWALRFLKFLVWALVLVVFGLYFLLIPFAVALIVELKMFVSFNKARNDPSPF